VSKRRKQAKCDELYDEDAQQAASCIGQHVSELERRRRYELKRDDRRSTIPLDFRCPRCHEVKLEAAKWVTNVARPLCLSCHRSSLRATRRQPAADDVCAVLRALRESRGVSQSTCARACSWSMSTQRRVESRPATHMKVVVMTHVLSEIGE